MEEFSGITLLAVISSFFSFYLKFVYVAKVFENKRLILLHKFIYVLRRLLKGEKKEPKIRPSDKVSNSN